ncbi:DUF6710 family protein [Acetobacterium bakii]|uniref:DUF6710 family protein n=1 Tax=Acetobacterium bakii TaxID=52689 RepID=UPI0006825FE2|nr:DUF6710 family protein [Acetobacterium bakii]
MFGKKKSKKPMILIDGSKFHFDQTFLFIQEGISQEKDIVGKIACLDFALKVLHSDLKHSILSEAIYKKDITALKDSYIPVVTPLKTDGQNWINQQTQEIIKPVLDFRIAIIFEVEKLKIELQQELETVDKKPRKRHAIPEAWRIFIVSKYLDAI